MIMVAINASVNSSYILRRDNPSLFSCGKQLH